MTYNEIVDNNGEDISTAFSNYFSTTFLELDNNQSSSISYVQNPFLDADISTIEFDKLLISNKLKKMDITKSAGPDNIPPIFLVKCADSLSLPTTLYYFFTFFKTRPCSAHMEISICNTRSQESFQSRHY